MKLYAMLINQIQGIREEFPFLRLIFDKIEIYANQFYHWQIHKWLKIVIVLGVLGLLSALFYYLYPLIYIGVIFMTICYFIFILERPEVYHLRKLREEVASFRDELRRYKHK